MLESSRNRPQDSNVVLAKTLGGSTKAVALLAKIMSGEEVAASTPSERVALRNAIMGLPDEFGRAEALKPVVLEMLDRTVEGSAVRSAIY